MKAELAYVTDIRDGIIHNVVYHDNHEMLLVMSDGHTTPMEKWKQNDTYPEGFRIDYTSHGHEILIPVFFTLKLLRLYNEENAIRVPARKMELDGTKQFIMWCVETDLPIQGNGTYIGDVIEWHGKNVVRIA